MEVKKNEEVNDKFVNITKFKQNPLSIFITRQRRTYNIYFVSVTQIVWDVFHTWI